MPVRTFNVMFFNFDDDRHTYYVVEDGNVQHMGDRIREAELPQRLEAVRHSGVHSVDVYIHRVMPSSISEWMNSDVAYKELISTIYVKLEPPDFVEWWIQKTHRLMSDHDAEFAELSITTVKE